MLHSFAALTLQIIRAWNPHCCWQSIVRRSSPEQPTQLGMWTRTLSPHISPDAFRSQQAQTVIYSVRPTPSFYRGRLTKPAEMTLPEAPQRVSGQSLRKACSRSGGLPGAADRNPRLAGTCEIQLAWHRVIETAAPNTTIPSARTPVFQEDHLFATGWRGFQVRSGFVAHRRNLATAMSVPETPQPGRKQSLLEICWGTGAGSTLALLIALQLKITASVS